MFSDKMENNNTVTKETNDTKAHFLLLTMSHIEYKIANALDQWYYLILVPAGVIGHILSFLVMLQKHNRHMSFSLYVCVLAVTDTISLTIALMVQLSHLNIRIPPDQETVCAVSMTVLSAATDSSTWFILSMTFERFYSIVRPHKAASFNTVKRARVIIVCIVVIFVLYSVPLFFMTSSDGTTCIPYAKGTDSPAGKVYYWSDQIIVFYFPFIALLMMNSVIIYTLRKRSTLLLTTLEGGGHGDLQGHSQGHSSKMKSSEKQIITMLLLVTFVFLIILIPTYGMTFYTIFVDFSSSPKLYAGFFLFLSVGEKTFYTNFGINFYLYVISGRKFRSELIKLFHSMFPCFCKIRKQPVETSSVNTEVTSKGLEITPG